MKLHGLIIASLLFPTFVVNQTSHANSQATMSALAAEINTQAYDINKGFADLVDHLNPAVVNVFTTQEIKQRYRRPGRNSFGQRHPFEDFFDHFFGMPGQEAPTLKRQSLGSGFIISKDGYVLTNNHVIQNATEIVVRLKDKREFNAEVVGTDKETDIALLKVKAKDDLPIVELGNSDTLRIGDWVVAIGNPFGLQHTVTAGIVSAKERVIGAGPYDQFIQTDASINPGNSGGPLFNLDGEVVGINTAIVAQGQGIGFAIPANVAKSLIPQLKETGSVARGWLGVGIQDLTKELAESFGLKEAKGALIGQVFEDSPADEAGLKSGDIIVEVGGKEVDDRNDLTNTIGMNAPGSKIKLYYIRDGKKKSVRVKLGDRHKGLAHSDTNVREKNITKSEKLEIEVVNLDQALRRKLRAPKSLKGVVISNVKPSSPLAEMIKPGDVIMSINRHSTATVADYLKVASGLKEGKQALLHIWRDGAAIYIATKIPKSK